MEIKKVKRKLNLIRVMVSLQLNLIRYTKNTKNLNSIRVMVSLQTILKRQLYRPKY